MFLNKPATRDSLLKLQLMGMPNDVVSFYAKHDGGFFGINGEDFPAPDGNKYRLKMFTAQNIISKIVHGYIEKEDETFRQAHKWYVFIDYGDANVLCIDCNMEGYGRVVDCFHETCNEFSGINIVANSFSDFMKRLYIENNIFWI